MNRFCLFSLIGLVFAMFPQSPSLAPQEVHQGDNLTVPGIVFEPNIPWEQVFWGAGNGRLTKPEEFHVHPVFGYLPTWRDLSALEGKKLSHIIEAFAYVTANETGYLDAGPLRKNKFAEAAESENMIPLVSIRNRAGFKEVIYDPGKRTVLVSSIVELAAQSGYKGVDIDLEGLTQDDILPYKELILEIRSALDSDIRTKSPRLLLTIAIQGNSIPCYSIDQLKEAIDYVMLMGYDYGTGLQPLGPWERRPGEPGRSVLGDLNKIVALGYPENRVIYILPLFARWGWGSDAITWKRIAAENPHLLLNITIDNYYLEKQLSLIPAVNGRTVYVSDTECISAKVRAALFGNQIRLSGGGLGNIGGVGAWEIGQDTADGELTNAIWHALGY